MITKQTNIKSIVERFVHDLSSQVESSTSEKLRSQLDGMLGSSTPKGKSAKSSGKRNYHRKPCPVIGCPNLASPRHSMVCPVHKDLTQHQKDEWKAEAMRPDGLWYQEKSHKN